MTGMDLRILYTRMLNELSTREELDDLWSMIMQDSRKLGYLDMRILCDDIDAKRASL